MTTFNNELKHGDHVCITDPLDQDYDCEAVIVKFDVDCGEYLIEFISGQSKGTQRYYSLADLELC